MKSFALGLTTTIIISTISFFVGSYLSVPVFLYEINEFGSDIRLCIENVGVKSANRTKFDILLRNEVKKDPVITIPYCIHKDKINNFINISANSEGYLVKYDDLGNLGEFKRKKMFEIIFLPKIANSINAVQTHDVNLSSSIKAFVINVDNIDITIWQMKWGIRVIITVIIIFFGVVIWFSFKR